MLSFPHKIEIRLNNFLYNNEERYSLEMRSFESEHAWRVIKNFHHKPSTEEIGFYRDIINQVLAAYFDGVKINPVMPLSYLEDNQVVEDENLPIEPPPCDDPVVGQIMRKMATRSAVGIKKYGTTLARKDLEQGDWLQHLQEELLDGAGYAQVLLNKL